MRVSGNLLIVVNQGISLGIQEFVFHQTGQFLSDQRKAATHLRTEYLAAMSPTSSAHSSPNSLAAQSRKNSEMLLRPHRSRSYAIERNHSMGSSRNFMDPTLRIQI